MNGGIGRQPKDWQVFFWGGVLCTQKHVLQLPPSSSPWALLPAFKPLNQDCLKGAAEIGSAKKRRKGFILQYPAMLKLDAHLSGLQSTLYMFAGALLKVRLVWVFPPSPQQKW